MRIYIWFSLLLLKKYLRFYERNAFPNLHVHLSMFETKKMKLLFREFVDKNIIRVRFVRRFRVNRNGIPHSCYQSTCFCLQGDEVIETKELASTQDSTTPTKTYAHKGVLSKTHLMEDWFIDIFIGNKIEKWSNSVLNNEKLHFVRWDWKFRVTASWLMAGIS